MQFRQAVRNLGQGMARFKRLEIGIAVLCAFTPVALIVFDTCFDALSHPSACAGEEGIRAAISHYWDMPDPVVFYVPLTIAGMLFVVNGVLKSESQYNWILGTALLVIVVFDHERFWLLHMAAVAVFFIGNVVVVARAVATRIVRVGVLVAAAAFFALGAVFDSAWSSNWGFWAEWASLLVITVHYVLVAWASDETYRAGVMPWEQRRATAEIAA